PGEPFLGADRSPRQQTCARDEPAGSREQDERDERSAGPRDRSQRRGVPVTASPEADPAEDEEDRADPGPEAEPAAIAAQGRGDANPSPPTAREEVDGSREEGQQHRDEHDLDRPATDQALPEEDVARRARSERNAL